MNYGDILRKLRNKNGKTLKDAAEYISAHSGKPISLKGVANWESGLRSPSIEQFLLMCEMYGVTDIQSAFRGVEYRGIAKLNTLGKSRVEEYISLLQGNSLFAETDEIEYKQRYIKLYDIPVAAGFGSYLDGDSYSEIEADGTVPAAADYAVKVSGDSMEPRFIDGQIIFIREQRLLEIGDIGIFGLNGDSYVKQLGRGQLLSLNARYKPLRIGEWDSFHIFGKVVG